MKREIERLEDAQAIEITEEELGKAMKDLPDVTEEEQRKWSFCPIIMKEDDGCVVILSVGGNAVRIKDKEAARRLFGAIMRSFEI